MTDLELAYRHADSPFHRMSPLAKTLYVLAVSLAAIFNADLRVGLFLFAFTLACAALSGVGLRAYWAFGKVLMPFILILLVVFPFFYRQHLTAGSTEVAVHTPIKDLTWSALAFGLLLALRFGAIGLSGLTFAFTTHPTDLVQACSRRGLDYRYVHAPVLGLVLFPSFLQLARDISITQRIRDLGQDVPWLRRRLLRLRHLAFALLVLGLRRGQTQAMALDIRGYGAHRTRTFMRPVPHSRAGTVFGWACIIAGGLYLLLQLGNLAGNMPWDL